MNMLDMVRDLPCSEKRIYSVQKGAKMLTEIEQLLIDGLALSKAKRSTEALVFILLEGENQQLEMCRFIVKNREATDEEILEMAYKISGQKA